MLSRIQDVFEVVYGSDVPVVHEGLCSEDVPQWDSLGHVRLMLALEREFNVKFTLSEASQIVSVSDITRILRQKGVQ